MTEISNRTRRALDIAGLSLDEARTRGVERIARLPRFGPAALRELFPLAFEGRDHVVRAEEIALLREWFHALQDLSPAMLTDADRALGNKIEAWSLRSNSA